MPDRYDQEDMHRFVDWMMPADEAFLEFLYAARDARGRPSVQVPKTIGINTGYSREHAAHRCKKLVEHDLVEQVDRGEYRLSELGRQLLEGDIEPESLNESDPSG